MAWVRMSGGGSPVQKYLRIELSPKSFGGTVEAYVKIYEWENGTDTRLVNQYVVSSAGSPLTTEYITMRYASWYFYFKILYPYYVDTPGGTLHPADTSEQTRGASMETPVQSFFIPIN